MTKREAVSHAEIAAMNRTGKNIRLIDEPDNCDRLPDRGGWFEVCSVRYDDEGGGEIVALRQPD